MWFIYTMEHYSAIKNKTIMIFSGKWTELENIIQSEVTLTPKGQAWYVLSDKWIFAIKYRIPMIHPTDPKKLKKAQARMLESHLEGGTK